MFSPLSVVINGLSTGLGLSLRDFDQYLEISGECFNEHRVIEEHKAWPYKSQNLSLGQKLG